MKRGVAGIGTGARLVLVALLLAAAPASAHRLAPSLFEVREQAAGRLALRWRTPLVQPRGAELEPRLPDTCRPVGPPSLSRDAVSATWSWQASCGDSGLVGARLGVDGLERSGTQVLLRVELADGRTVRALLDGERSALAVPARSSPWRVARDHVALGFGHIFTGLDHLLFVLGLVLLVSGGRPLLATVTAFTLGHSVTLSLAALGCIHFPTDLAELGIAASVLVLALELCREPDRGSPLARRPWAMAAAFGLLHGLGFAGALAQVGLPQDEIPLSLFSFNVGIEAGQILFVAGVLAAMAAGRAVFAHRIARVPRWLGLAPAYGIGSLAALWCLERGAELSRSVGWP